MKKLISAVIPIVIFGIFGFVSLDSDNCSSCSAINGVHANTVSKISAGFLDGSETVPVTLTEQNFESEVFESEIPVVVEFYAKWCGACNKLSPIIDELTNENDGVLKFGKLEVDENPNIADEYGIDAIPRLLVFHKGKIVKDIVGYHSKDELQTILTDVCSNCQNM